MRMETIIRSLTLTLLGFLLLPQAYAATFVIPTDEELIERATIIATGTIISSRAEASAEGAIETMYRFAVDEVLKGDPATVLGLREWGGALDGQWMEASGTPRYENGRRYLVFFDLFRDGRLTTLELALGRFEFRQVDGTSVLVRDLGDSQILGHAGNPIRIASEFLDTIRDMAEMVPGKVSKREVPSLLANDLDTRAAAAKGASQWSSGTTVSYSISSSPATGNTKGNDGEERILVDDPNGDIAGSFGGSGTIAIAFFGGTTAGFTDRVNITYSDIVVQDGVGTSSGVTQEEYATVITHELGHTLGFRHANQNKFSQTGSSCAAPLPCSSSAVMNSFVLSGLNGNLQAWDKSAVQSNYGSTPNSDYLIVDESSLRPWYRTNTAVAWRLFQGTSSCNGPTITAGPAANPPVILSGQTSQLSVSATASQGTLQFQWFRGTSGNTNEPVSGGTMSTITVSPGQTSSYWVRITDACGSIDSSTVQVTVAVCEPVIIQQPQNKVIGPGETTTLVVTAANAESYFWYVGASGNTSIFAGSGSSLSVSPAQTTSYWVRVGNSCGTIDSASATVQVLQCPPPVIVRQPADVDIQSGEKATLQVVATGDGQLLYEWYLGATGDTSTPIGGNVSVIVLENVTANTDAWVRVHDECGFRDSRTARIRIVTICTPPAIVTEPSGMSVPRGGTAVLQVEATGTSLIYQWVRRAGAISLEVKDGTGPTLQTEPIQEDRIYYVRVRNNCGSIQSRDAIVTVSDCSVPRIVSQTEDQKLKLGSSIVLDVVADGSGLQYQWYEGESGDVRVPVKQGTGPNLQVGPLSGTVRFWVRVSGECGSLDGETIVLHVDPVRGRPARRP